MSTLLVATVHATSPLSVRMPLASTPQPATSLSATALSANTSVVVAVLDSGATYVLGPA